jgi:hypothetical protein
VRAKFQLTTISALKDHGGEATQERELTPKEEQDLRLSWDLYRGFLARDVETVELLDKIYGRDKHSTLINTLDKRACWRVGHETQMSGGLYINHDFRFIWTASEEGSVTGYDEYYRCLGAIASRKAWEE